MNTEKEQHFVICNADGLFEKVDRETFEERMDAEFGNALFAHIETYQNERIVIDGGDTETLDIRLLLQMELPEIRIQALAEAFIASAINCHPYCAEELLALSYEHNGVDVLVTF